MTDWQPPLVVLCTRANGMSVVHETIFEDRLGYIDALQHMKAEVELFEQCLVGNACRFAETGALHSALVRGVSPLEGAEVEMPDIRAAFAYVIAAAAANSPSILHGVHHLERGYDHVFEKFSELGLGRFGSPSRRCLLCRDSPAVCCWARAPTPGGLHSFVTPSLGFSVCTSYGRRPEHVLLASLNAE